MSFFKIAATTLGTDAVTTIEFSSIASTYKDLRLIFTGQITTTGGSGNLNLRFNNDDTAGNYVIERLGADGGSTISAGDRSQSFIYLDDFGSFNNNIPFMTTIDIFSYASSQKKLCLLTGYQNTNKVSDALQIMVGEWQKTDVISSIQLFSDTGSTMLAGTTASLYGIKAA